MAINTLVSNSFRRYSRAAVRATRDREPDERRVAHLQKAQNIDFTDRLFHASGSGRGKVKKALLLAMGRLSIDEIDPSDRADFERALGR